MAGCNGGTICNLPWAVEFPRGASLYNQQLREGLIDRQADFSLAVHPTQLYEALFGLCSLALLLYLWKRRGSSGQVFLTGMLWYATYRFASEFLRSDAGGWHPLGVLTFSQLVSLLLGAAVLVAFEVHRRRRESRPAG